LTPRMQVYGVFLNLEFFGAFVPQLTLNSRALYNILSGARDLVFLDASELYKISEPPNG
jgi:hypothetical protein